MPVPSCCTGATWYFVRTSVPIPFVDASLVGNTHDVLLDYTSNKVETVNLKLAHSIADYKFVLISINNSGKTQGTSVYIPVQLVLEFPNICHCMYFVTDSSTTGQRTMVYIIDNDTFCVSTYMFGWSSCVSLDVKIIGVK